MTEGYDRKTSADECRRVRAVWPTNGRTGGQHRCTRMLQEHNKAAQYRRAANQGLAAGQCRLGVMYEDGTGVPRNHYKADTARRPPRHTVEFKPSQEYRRRRRRPRHCQPGAADTATLAAIVLPRARAASPATSPVPISATTTAAAATAASGATVAVARARGDRSATRPVPFALDGLPDVALLFLLAAGLRSMSWPWHPCHRTQRTDEHGQDDE